MTPGAAGAMLFRFSGPGRVHALLTPPEYSVPVRCSVSGMHSCMGTISRPFRSRQSSMVRTTLWWQRWTQTQLWELRKWARAGPFLGGLVHRPRKGSVENGRLQPAGG